MKEKNLKQEFLHLAIIEQLKYDEIETKLNVSRGDISKWWDDMKEERKHLSKIRRIWRTKFKDKNDIPGFWRFKKWYDNKTEGGAKCCYCGITQDELDILYKKDPVLTSRNRGRHLEIERKAPKLTYEDLSNCELACYWCNNAKTDTFTAVEFKKVGKVIGEIWKARLNK